MSTPQGPAGRPRYQDPKDLVSLYRSSLHSHYRQHVDRLKDGGSRFPSLSAFLPTQLWPWVSKYLEYAFRRKHPFLSYQTAQPTSERGVYKMAPTCKLSILGDWGTGTSESQAAMDLAMDPTPEYTIHLGDVYYVGDKDEIQENCEGQNHDGYAGVKWRTGSVGSFAMNGNHEMYANGDAYFDDFIGTLGIPSSSDKKQLTSYFCLENEFWRIIGIDTGYNSTGLPILNKIPLLNRIGAIGGDGKLEDELIDWLRNTVKPAQRPRATILLSHHQYFSAFEGEYPRPAKQLAEFFPNQDLIWLWGHEHRMAVYGKYSPAGISAYGRCIGHGGMPVELKQPNSGAKAPLQFYDGAVYNPEMNVGWNGLVKLTLDGNTATLDYLRISTTQVLQERFTATGTAIAQQFTAALQDLVRGPAAPAQPPATRTSVAGQPT